MRKPRLLDLYCCQGGAGVGYARAGFEVVGVDIAPQPHYPFEFHQADALEYLAEHGHEFDAVHASPPCQAYSVTRHTHGKDHPELIEPTRDALDLLGLPYIIENVEGAKPKMVEPLLLCGSMFGLVAKDTDGVLVQLQRHRLFESNVWLMGAGGCVHTGAPVAGVYGGAWGGSHARQRSRKRRGGYVPVVSVSRELLGIDWMKREGLSQAIPPAYTEFLGRQILDHMEHEGRAERRLIKSTDSESAS